jgi:hypothetical protein
MGSLQMLVLLSHFMDGGAACSFLVWRHFSPGVDLVQFLDDTMYRPDEKEELFREIGDKIDKIVVVNVGFGAVSTSGFGDG